MKSIILSLLGILLCSIVVSIIFRLSKSLFRSKIIVKTFFLVLSFLIIFNWILPYDLYFLPSWMLFSDQWIDIFFTIFLFTAVIFGGVLQLYNLSERGFSLRILIDIHESPNKAMTFNNIIQGYSAGRGIKWMYEKRLTNMLEQKLILFDNENVVNTNKGARIALLFIMLRNLYRLPIPKLKDF